MLPNEKSEDISEEHNDDKQNVWPRSSKHLYLLEKEIAADNMLDIFSGKKERKWALIFLFKTDTELETCSTFGDFDIAIIRICNTK